ncbi:MAG TPA: hypothetical protein VFU98_11420 [Microlunatus sp.]|nr:hypothetical protein [Microlunatus sp.]
MSIFSVELLGKRADGPDIVGGFTILTDQSPQGGVVALAGNPRPGSRTRVVATRLADGIADVLLDAPDPVTTLDLAEIAEQLLAEAAPEPAR